MSIPFGGINLDPVEIGSQGNAILGIRDSGKTYTAMLLAEGLFDAGIPFVAFDPIGVWRYLRVPGAGKGYPIVVAGGQDGDLPLTVATAPMIVEAAMRQGVSVVLDFFHMELSKADWRRIVRDCVRLLLHKNKEFGLRHIFLEEAAEFAPQRVLDGDVYAEIEKLARMGGNSRLGYTLINQRAQEVNKAVLELCDSLFLHRQKGKNALDSLKRWLELAGAAGAEVMASLPTLPQGECWAWLSGSDIPVHVKVPTKNSQHPDRRMMHGDVATSKKPVSVGKFVNALQAAIPKLEEEKKAADPKALHAEIANLKRQLTAKIPYPDLREEVAALRTAAQSEKRMREAAEKKLEQIGRIVGVPPLVSVPATPVVTAVEAGEGAGRRRIEYAAPAPAPAPASRPAGNGGGTVPPGCAKPLAVLAGIYPGGMTESQWATVGGYKKSGGTWGSYKRGLLREGLVEKRGDMWHATELGAASAGPVELPPPAGPELARWWAKRIPGTPKVVEALISCWPHPVQKDILAQHVEMEPSGGTFGSYIRGLVRNGIATHDSTGIRLSADVMGG